MHNVQLSNCNSQFMHKFSLGLDQIGEFSDLTLQRVGFGGSGVRQGGGEEATLGWGGGDDYYVALISIHCYKIETVVDSYAPLCIIAYNWGGGGGGGGGGHPHGSPPPL